MQRSFTQKAMAVSGSCTHGGGGESSRERPEGMPMAAPEIESNRARPPGLIQRYREELQTRHYARRTVDTYEQWLRRFLRFHRPRHPRQMGSEEVNAFLTHLAVEKRVSPSTQNQALSALLFLYRELLEMDLDLEGVVRARARRRLPLVLSEVEVRAVRQELEGDPALVVGLLYGSGLRLMEALRLRDVALCLGEKVPPCQPAIGVAMGVSPAKPLA